MNRQITRLAVAGVVLMAALIVATTYWQAWAAPGLQDRQDNAIERVAQFQIDRGAITNFRGRVPLAENVQRKVKGNTFYFRRYPQGALTAHVVGYATQARSRAGLERSMNAYLTASNSQLATVLDTALDRLRGGTIHGNDVFLTLNLRAQRAAMAALGNRCGAVVALEPKTGRVLVHAQRPTYDPNLIEENFAAAQRAPGSECRPAAPLLVRSTDGLYVPGSTFKIVTASAAVDSGKYTIDSTFQDPGYCVEYGKRVFNYSDQGTPAGYGTVNLRQAIQYSINSVFCNLGKDLGAGTLIDYAKRFGFYARPPLETPDNERAPSGLYQGGRLFDPEDDNQVDPGRFAFGQERLLVTPMQMAMVAATIGNDGVLMEPHVVDRVVAPDGTTIRTTKPKQVRQVISKASADAVTEGMKAAVAGGTSTAAQLPGIEVAGKTGTAESGQQGVNTVSFVCFAPADDPQVAVAVFVERQRSTGGQTAAPIARQVLEALLQGSR
ncbi:MAG TPA: penicillin-binding protein 2 [Gaiellaceae bacterium]|nr:penicillin-binding protein 2 [Gaiellaceae bacterium]